MKASEQRKIARVATELAALNESFKGYIAQTGNAQFKYVWLRYFLISDNLTIPSIPSKVFFSIKLHLISSILQAIAISLKSLNLLPNFSGHINTLSPCLSNTSDFTNDAWSTHCESRIHVLSYHLSVVFNCSSCRCVNDLPRSVIPATAIEFL